CRLPELLLFLFVQRDRHVRLHSVESYDGRHTECNSFDAVLSVHHGGDGQNGTLIAHDTFADTFYGHGDTVISSTFLFDDLVGAVFNGIGDLLHGSLMIEMSPHFTEGIQWDTGYICAAPCGD